MFVSVHINECGSLTVGLLQQGVLDGSDTWLLVSVWTENKVGPDKLLGKAAISLSASTIPQIEVLWFFFRVALLFRIKRHKKCGDGARCLY